MRHDDLPFPTRQPHSAHARLHALSQQTRDNLWTRPQHIHLLLIRGDIAPVLAAIDAIERAAFLARAQLRRAADDPVTARAFERLDAAFDALRHELHIELCPSMLRQCEAMTRLLDERSPQALDLFIEVTMALRESWNHARAIMAPPPA